MRRIDVKFKGHLRSLILDHVRQTRELTDPNGRLILATLDEIRRGYVDGKDDSWKIPTNNAIDIKLLE